MSERPRHRAHYCPVDETGRQLLGAAMRQMNLSARAYHRVLKLARTTLAPAAQAQAPRTWRGWSAHLHCAARNAVQVSSPRISRCRALIDRDPPSAGREG